MDFTPDRPYCFAPVCKSILLGVRLASFSPSMKFEIRSAGGIAILAWEHSHVDGEPTVNLRQCIRIRPHVEHAALLLGLRVRKEEDMVAVEAVVSRYTLTFSLVTRQCMYVLTPS